MLAHPSAPEEFISICMEGIPTGYALDVNRCILRKESGAVKSLEKLTLFALAEEAMKDKEKEEQLKSMIASTEPNSFNRLIFGDCQPFSKFIISTMASECKSSVFRVTRSNINISFPGVIIDYNFQADDSPNAKLLELLPYAIKSNFNMAMIDMDRRIPRVVELFKKVKEISDRCLPHLHSQPAIVGMGVVLLYERSMAYY